MENPTPQPQTQAAPMARSEDIDGTETHGRAGTKAAEPAKKRAPLSSRLPSIIVGVVIAALVGVSIWFLVRPVPLLVQLA